MLNKKKHINIKNIIACFVIGFIAKAILLLYYCLWRLNNLAIVEATYRYTNRKTCDFSFPARCGSILTSGWRIDPVTKDACYLILLTSYTRTLYLLGQLSRLGSINESNISFTPILGAAYWLNKWCLDILYEPVFFFSKQAIWNIGQIQKRSLVGNRKKAKCFLRSWIR